MNANEARRPMLSGWCMPATGARPKCEGCRIEDCACECHIPVTPESEPFETMSGTAERPPSQQSRCDNNERSRGLADRPSEGTDRPMTSVPCPGEPVLLRDVLPDVLAIIEAHSPRTGVA